MYINPYSIPPLISSIILVLFGFFVVKKNPRARLNISFAFICLVCTVWLVSYAIAYSCREDRLIEFMFRIGNCGVSLIIVACLYYTTAFVKKNTKINILAFLFGLTGCFLTLKTNYLLNGIRRYFWGYYAVAGPLHPYFLFLFAAFIFYTFFIIFAELKNIKFDQSRLNQTKYIIIAFIVFSLGSVDFLPKYGVEIYPFGYLPTVIFLAIIAYAIVKHHLMDISIVIRKGFVYSILAAFISIAYLVLVVLTEKLFRGMIGYQSFLISTIYILGIAILFNPFKNKIQHVADRMFLGRDPMQIVQENELLRREVERTDRLKAVAAFASGMAHEIKNPLTAIKTFSEYLPQKINDQQFLNKFSKIVGNEVGRIDNLVHQLLEFSRPAPLKLEEVNVNKLLDDTLELLSSDFLKHNIKVIKEFNADLRRSSAQGGSASGGNADNHELQIRGEPLSKDIRENPRLTIKADPNKLKQSFLNLFINAIEAMPAGGTLTISTSIGVNPRQEKSAEIRVQDTGCGIPEKDLPHIFEPFHSTKEQGTGLGLSITYGIIKEHNGHVRVESKVSQGARFVIELPRGRVSN